ncbi:MAG: AAA family ATPase [Betaproteobacteria bacterium]|jgi:RecA-family ATPase|nr:AAA family ATPase [Betaproteobacteria bacterium]
MLRDRERAADALNYLDAGCSREDWVRIGMAAKSAGLDFEDFHTWSATAGNYKGESECRTVWKSFSESGGVTPATLFGMARAQGWSDKTRAKDERPAQSITKPSPAPKTPVKQAASANAVDVWERCIPATPAEPYIYRKKGTPDGLRIYPASAPPLVIRGQNVAGYLVVPCWSGEHLQTLQFIPPGKADKLNLAGASFGDGFFTVGQIAERVFIVEGIGQAWAVNQATGAAAVVCFGAGRMATVAKKLRSQYPAARLVIVPDKGKEERAGKIAAAVSGEWVAMPADKPENYDANDYLQDAGASALLALLERAKGPEMRYRPLSDDDLCKLPPLRWRIKRVLPQTGLAAIYGASGSGKSFLVLDALQALAAGREWFGYKTKPCTVLYCALEGEGGIAGRVVAYRIRHGATAQNIRYLVQPFSLLDGEDITDLAQAIKAAGQGAGVVVLDTLNRAAPGADENDSKSMGQIIAAAKELQTLVGGLVVLVHHTGKDASKGLRGHSSLQAALDAAIEVRRDGDNREWLIAKSKDGEDGEAHPFKLDIVELGTDEDGEPITSCTVHPLDKVTEVMRRPLPPKSGNQRAVWDALGEIFRKAGNIKPEGAPDTVPEGRPCITLDAAIDATRTKLVCEPKRQTERAQAAIRGLVDKGLLVHEGGFVWCK